MCTCGQLRSCPVVDRADPEIVASRQVPLVLVVVCTVDADSYSYDGRTGAALRLCFKRAHHCNIGRCCVRDTCRDPRNILQRSRDSSSRRREFCVGRQHGWSGWACWSSRSSRPGRSGWACWSGRSSRPGRPGRSGRSSRSSGAHEHRLRRYKSASGRHTESARWHQTDVFPYRRRPPQRPVVSSAQVPSRAAVHTEHDRSACRPGLWNAMRGFWLVIWPVAQADVTGS